MLPKKGRRLPAWAGAVGGREAYARVVAELLCKELGNSRGAIKQLMRQTDACERTVKHWLSGQHGPDTVYFLRLVVTSPAINAFVLELIESLASNPSPASVDRHSTAAAKEVYAAREAASMSLKPDCRNSDPNNVPYRVPVHDPKPVELNKRQRWFLARIDAGSRSGAREIMAVWKVSLKTARRDIRGLQQGKILEYVGSRRKGRYRHLAG